ncbi:acyl-homoserine-lactone synthase [uncultured Roseobacter sp.]|uniref:acyl-homoserine-lactone synthase n=1 Tax=uncultured Roseobacter sp. TaxID=114847 RepID=UPI00261CD3AC|nr:acyl-homoserine-lactone synthase [uncultured Roseobacter sp.]
MKAIISTRNTLPGPLVDGIFADRKKQFVDRLNWDLCVNASGHEIDEYDDALSDYLVVHDEERHIGSCRVRSVEHSTMIVDHFLEVFPNAEILLEMQKERVYELTRFCRSPDISADESKHMLLKIAQLMDAYRDLRSLTGFLAVVFPKVARFMDKIGMRYLMLSESKINGQLVYMICITHAAPSIAEPMSYFSTTIRTSKEELLVA